jgi:hypothetical protein
MKTKMRLILIVLLVITFASCNSEKLDKEKIKKLYTNCVEKEFYKDVVLEKLILGEKRILNPKINSNNTLENYKNLEDLGLIKIESNNTSFIGYVQYNIDITEKGKPFLVKIKDKDFVICYNKEIEDVKNIVTNDKLPFAQANIIFKKTNPTPFASLSNKENEKILVNLKKTEIGWTLCDNN